MAEVAPGPPAAAAPKRLDLPSRLAKIEAEGLEADRRELDLSDQAVGDEGVEQLVRGLAANTGLRRLLLQRSGLSAAGFRAVGSLLVEGAQAARRRDRVARSEDGGDASTAGGYADSLECLVLSGNDCSVGLPRELCEGLAASASLRRLALSGCSLGDAGVAPLLRVLGLQDTGAQQACPLQEVDLSQNGLGPETARALAVALGMNVHLRNLDLKANAFGLEGAAALAECVRANKGRLHRLDVSQNALQLEGVRLLVDIVRKPVIFPIHISRPGGVNVGMGLDSSTRVMGVHPRGLIERWNQKNPSEAVCVGDLVARVNSKEDPEDILKELTEVQELEIWLSRPDKGVKFLDVCFNNITLTGVEELREILGVPVGGSLRMGVVTLDGDRKINMNAC